MRFLKYLTALPLLISATVFAAPADRDNDTIESVKRSIECDAMRCQPCQNDPCNPCCRLMPGYNAPASPMLNCAWDWYVTGSFIYWQVMQDDMEVADLAPAAFSSTVPASPNVVQVDNFNFKYKPGFKVAIGTKLNYDNWDLFAEYTWFHTNHMTTTYTATGVPVFTGAALTSTTGATLTGRFVSPVDSSDTTYFFNKASRSWKVKFDFIDLMLARCYYVGKKFTMHTAIGARAAYMRQNVVFTGFSTGPFTSGTVGTTITIPVLSGRDVFFSNNWVSWGYGLRACLGADWLIGGGFKVIGNGAFDLLYTRYDLTSNFNTMNIPVGGLQATQRHVNTLRPHAEIEWGFAWANCFANGRWFVDLEATYGFQMFWNQNMSLEGTASTLPADDLYIHGLRFTARFDF